MDEIDWLNSFAFLTRCNYLHNQQMVSFYNSCKCNERELIASDFDLRRGLRNLLERLLVGEALVELSDFVVEAVHLLAEHEQVHQILV